MIETVVKGCKKCGRKELIPEYEHVQEGICFSCWGSGSPNFESIYPQLIPVFKNIVENDSSKQLDIMSLSQRIFLLDFLLRQAEIEEDFNGMAYYDAKIHELITKIYRLQTK
ncbi:hypothetical protein [Ectobacillus panaciterrae]|uniref:hypothetical protein n=1 Tax=Ectobacillus panaciterrae TaxID=363872 RepID=UPI00040745CE|nr:hypothetical protein [Ectobacillus panaciterrae]